MTTEYFSERTIQMDRFIVQTIAVCFLIVGLAMAVIIKLNLMQQFTVM